MSIRKELTAQNVLLGFQHVFVSNVWLDPVFVAGAIGLPIALSSNMINAIFIVSGSGYFGSGHSAGSPAGGAGAVSRV